MQPSIIGRFDRPLN